ncbi:MAG: hypothetical protein K2Y22_17740 [Candidatus Obscuribacterales bacterium]|nr:hypothetical protein [Candidatus Obscuribacterales bacterium]
MHLKRRQKGNMLILLVTVVGFVVLIGVLVLNVNQLIGVHKQAQNAIDAAALQAAIDMGRVVVDGPQGRLALVDDPEGDIKWPVRGINTQLATLRLDAIIAEKLGSKSMQYMVNHDLNETKAAIKLLREKIAASAAGASGAVDRNNKPVNIKESAYQVYIANNVRISGSAEPPKDFQVSVGHFNDIVQKGAIQIPVPTPETIDSVSYSASNSRTAADGRKYYVADVEYPLAGTMEKVRFGFVAGQPSLVENSAFEKIGDDIPVLAQVMAAQPVSSVAETQKEEQQTEQEKKIQFLSSIATAQVGNRVLLAKPGVLEVAFNGAIPADGPGGIPSFKSVKSIMNSSQLDASNSSSKSPYAGWDKDTPGEWFQIEGGPYTGGGSPVSKPFKGITGRDDDDPSVALAFFAYDWLRSLDYRPNGQAVIDALSAPFAQIGASAGEKQIFAGRVDDLLQPVYAQSAGSTVTSGELFIIPGEFTHNQIMVNGQWLNGSDPRNLKQYNNDPAAYQRQNARMWGYVPAEGVLPPSTAMVKIEPAWYGPNVMTLDGNPFWHLQACIDRIQAVNSSAAILYQAVADITNETLKNDPQLKEMNGKLGSAQSNALSNKEMAGAYQSAGYDAIANSLSSGAVTDTPLADKIELRKQEVVSKLYKDKPKLLAALINATYASEVTTAMVKHMKALSGGGAKFNSGTHFVLSGTDFFPPTLPYSGMMAYAGGYTNVYVTHAYSYVRGGTDFSQELAHIKSQMLSDKGTLPTGQDFKAPGAKDWLALPKNEGGKAVSQLQFYKHTAEPLIGKKEGHSTWIVPALAQSATPPAKLIYHFRLADNSLNDPAGTQKIATEVDKVAKYASVPINKGQVMYQSTSGLVSAPTKDNPTIMYHIYGRDMHANAHPADHFGELAAAWAISCPVVPAQKTPVPPTIDIFQFAYRWCGGSADSQAFSVLEFSGYPFLFSTIVNDDPVISTPWGNWQTRRYGAIITTPPPPPQYIT